MKQMIYALDLKDNPDLISKYETYHSLGHVPDEIIKSIRDAHILNMRIFRIENRLVMIVDIDERFDPEEKAKSDAASKAVQDWEEKMLAYQQPLPWASENEKWMPLTEIFDLSQH